MASTTASGRILIVPGKRGEGIGWASAVLSWSGYQVDRAESVEPALRMLAAAPYDLLILGYNSSPEDVQLSVDILQNPGARLPTLVLLSDEEEFITPPQTHFVPTAFLEPGFTTDELLRLVEKLRQFRR